MNTSKFLFSCLLIASTISACAQESDADKAKKTEVWSPVPKILTPPKKFGDAPSDAIILFDGKDLNKWVSSKDTMQPAAWIVDKGVLTVNKKAGNIQTKQSILSTAFKMRENK